MRDDRDKGRGPRGHTEMDASETEWQEEVWEEDEPERRGFPFVRVLLFLVLFAAIGGLLLLALTGLEPAALREQGWTAVRDRMEQALGETPVRTQVLATLPAELPDPYMAVQGEMVLLCSNGELRALDEDGVERWLRPVQLQTPYLCVEGRDVLYADLTGRTFGIVRDGASFFEKQSTHPLYNAYLSKDFLLLLQHPENAGYSAIMDAYSREGGAVFTSYLTDYSPFLVRQAPGEGQDAIVLSGLSAQLTTAGGVVEFLAPDTTRLGGISSEDDLYVSVLQMDNGTTALVGGKSMRLVDRDFLSAGIYEPEGNPITAAALLDGHSPVLAVMDARRYETTRQEKSWIRTFDASGTLKREIVLDGRVTRLVTAPNLLAVATERRVTFLDGEGSELYAFDARESVRDVVVTTKGKAYVMADGQLTLVRVRESKGLLGLFSK